MALSLEQRSQLIAAIARGDIKQIQEFKKAHGGKKFVLNTFLDMLKFSNTVDENHNYIDREAQMESGEIQVELRDPIKSTFERISREADEHQDNY